MTFFISEILRPYLLFKVNAFSAGQISYYLKEWAELTSDPHILRIVSGDMIEFDQPLETQHQYPANSISRQHVSLVKQEISSLLSKNVIKVCTHEEGEFISPIFCVPKKDGKIRLILNLKKLNSFVSYHHFKMETIHSILAMITPNCWMASVDLKDAYYSVRIHPSCQRYLKFVHEGSLYAYTVYPNGLASCPRQFTKLLKPPIAHLRSQGHLIASYIDDIYLQSDTYEGCINTVLSTFRQFNDLGFVVHPEKSEFIPKQTIQFLGFILDSRSMTITLPADRITRIKEFFLNLRSHYRSVSIRDTAKAIGYMVSCLPAVPFGGIHYRTLENDKIQALKMSKGNFDAPMALSKLALSDVDWWLSNVNNSFGYICRPPSDLTLYSDASLSGWGAVLDSISSGGPWSPTEAMYHINVLELLAAYFALKSFRTQVANKHVKLMIDNTTAVAVINHMGTNHSHNCNVLATKIWNFCYENRIWITACHIPGEDNVEADRESRCFFKQDAEWMLSRKCLSTALSRLNFKPEIDLFASRLNKQFEKYCSLRPDPNAFAIDAFTLSWSTKKFYCFPPFSCISRILQKVKQDKATGILVAPMWPTQVWYPILVKMLCAAPVHLRPRKTLLCLPALPQAQHPLLHKLKLMVCLVSGNCTQTKVCLLPP